MSESWRYIQNGAPQGPVTEEALKQLIGTGQLRWEDLVWRPGMTGWTKAGQVPELLPPRPEPTAPPAPGPEGHNPFKPPRAAVLSSPEPTTLEARAAIAGALEALRATKPWARFLGVLGMVGIALMFLVSILLSVLSRGPFRGMPPRMRVVLPLFYLLIGGFQVPLVVYLNRYATRIGVLLESQAPADLKKALDAQKSFWRYLGIITLVIMCIYALVLLFALGMAAFVGVVRRF
jgi:hypothetical protein